MTELMRYRLPVQVGRIRELHIYTISDPTVPYTYGLRASTSGLRDSTIVGEWSTFEEAAEEFKVWDDIRKKQRRELE